MKKILLFSLLLLSFSVQAAEIIELADEIRIPLPTNWAVYSDSSGYPYTIINEDESVELSIHKSQISENNKISTKEELRLSVDQVIKDIILTLPAGFYYTNTGNFADNNLNFVLEFVSKDTIAEDQIYHRLKGVLYNHPDGHQILFTLWGQTDEAHMSILRNEILFAQDNFAYTGPAEVMTLQKPFKLEWYYIFLVVMICAGILYFFRTFALKSKSRDYSKVSYLIRCECGHRNKGYAEVCSRCGQPLNNEINV